MTPNIREIDDAVLYVKDALTYLCPMEDEYAIEALLVAIEFLTGDVLTYEEVTTEMEDGTL